MENDWVGRILSIGDEVRFQINDPCPRCVMTTLPQGDLPKDPNVLRTIVQHNQGNVGVLATSFRADASSAVTRFLLVNDRASGTDSHASLNGDLCSDRPSCVVGHLPTDRPDRAVEIPVGKGGEVQVAEIISRLARASDASLERPAADLTLSTQGLARALTKTLLSETLGPDVAITFRPGHDGDDDRRTDSDARSIARSGCAGSAILPNAPRRPHANGSLTACTP